MAKEICIKTREGTFCKASPIRDCGCDPDPFDDPYEGLDEKGDLDDPRQLIDALRKVIEHRTVDLGGKGRSVLIVTQLLLLSKVPPGSDFIITGLEKADTVPAR